MKSLFFSSSKSPLYGVIHPSKSESKKKEGVVLCYPFGQEYMRSHRAYRQISNLLTRKGYNVLRFDYRGTGDSSNYMESVGPDDWVEDIFAATSEVKEQFHLQKVALVGLRLGALLASAAVAQKPKDFSRLVLWDPIISGDAYKEELLEEIASPDVAPWNYVDKEDGTIHFNGFPLTPFFMKQLNRYNLLELKLAEEHIFHVVSDEKESSNMLKSALGSSSSYRYQLAPAPGDWNYVDSFGGILLPQPVIKSIVDQF
jgi:pimeloyl-ACP methyl ester carboxylesterase